MQVSRFYLMLGVIVAALMLWDMERASEKWRERLEKRIQSDVRSFGSIEESRKYWNGVAEKHPSLFNRD